MQTITPFLMFEGTAEQALTFYISVFDDSEVVSLTRYGADAGAHAGKVVHATVRLAGREIACIDSPAHHAFTFTPATSLYVACESEAEVDRIFGALADGGAILMPLGEYPFSRRYGWLNDRFGVSWQVAVRA